MIVGRKLSRVKHETFHSPSHEHGSGVPHLLACWSFKEVLPSRPSFPLPDFRERPLLQINMDPPKPLAWFEWIRTDPFHCKGRSLFFTEVWGLFHQTLKVRILRDVRLDPLLFETQLCPLPGEG